jgi:MFS family permease
LGISSSDASFIYAGGFLVACAGSFLWPFVADLIARPKLVVLICSVCSCIIFQLFLLVDRIQDSTSRFSLNILLIMCWTICYSALQPLLDSLVLKMIPDRTLYGAQRAWLSIGFGMCAIIISSYYNFDCWCCYRLAESSRREKSILPSVLHIYLCDLCICHRLLVYRTT